MIENLQYVSILLEAVIVVLSLFIARKRKAVGLCLALTFAIYVFYDTAKLIQLSIPNIVLYPLFFIATLSALCAVWKVYRE